MCALELQVGSHRSLPQLLPLRTLDSLRDGPVAEPGLQASGCRLSFLYLLIKGCLPSSLPVSPLGRGRWCCWSRCRPCPRAPGPVGARWGSQVVALAPVWEGGPQPLGRKPGLHPHPPRTQLPGGAVNSLFS